MSKVETYQLGPSTSWVLGRGKMHLLSGPHTRMALCGFRTPLGGYPELWTLDEIKVSVHGDTCQRCVDAAEALERRQ